MEAGNFWSLYENNGQPSAKSVFDRMTPFTLEDVLMCDGVINDAKFDVARVINYLNIEENLIRIIDLVTIRVPRPDNKEKFSRDKANRLAPHKSFYDTEKGGNKNTTSASLPAAASAFGLSLDQFSHENKFKLPYICSELIFYSSTLASTIATTPRLLHRLFAFLDAPFPLDPSCTGYFRKIVLSLLQRSHPSFMSFVRSRHVIETLIANMELHCCMELLIVIGWDAGAGYLQDPDWLAEVGLVPALLSTLHPEHPYLPELATHVTRALVDLIVKCPDSRPVILFQEPNCVDVLISLVRSSHPRIVPGALTLLVVLAQRDPFLQDPVTYCATRGAGETYLSTQITALVPTLVSIASPEQPSFPDFVCDEDVLFDRQASQDGSTQRSTVTPYSARIAGDARLKAVELLSVGVRAATQSFVDAFFASGGFKPLFALMLRFPWNSLLHALVETCICAALQSRVGALYDHLLRDSDLVPWLLRCFRISREYIRAGKHGRLGYMAYAVRVASIVHRAVDADEVFGASVRQHVPPSVWEEFVTEVNEATHVSTQQQLYRALRIAVKRTEVDADANQHLHEQDSEDPDVYTLASQLAHHDIQPTLIESFPFIDAEPITPITVHVHEHDHYDPLRPVPILHTGITTLLQEHVQSALHALMELNSNVTREKVAAAVTTLDATALLQLSRMLPRDNAARPHLEELAAMRPPATPVMHHHSVSASASVPGHAHELTVASKEGMSKPECMREGAFPPHTSLSSHTDMTHLHDDNAGNSNVPPRPHTARDLLLPGLASMRRQRSAEEWNAGAADSPAHYSQRMLGRVTVEGDDTLDSVRFEDSAHTHSQELERAKALFADVRRMQDFSEDEEDDDDDDFFVNPDDANTGHAFSAVSKDAGHVDDDSSWPF